MLREPEPEPSNMSSGTPLTMNEYVGYINFTRKVKVLSLLEVIKEKSTFRAKALRFFLYRFR